MDGTFYSKFGKEQPDDEKQYNEMPMYSNDSWEIQTYLSEYSINSLLNAVIDTEMYSYTFSTNSDNIDSLVDNFEKFFGRDEETTIFVRPSKGTKKYKP
jgi:hypothetical protein